MNEIGIDIETHSSTDLPGCGVYRYVEAPDFIKIPIMYNLISTIAERCHASATRRGKDTSWISCIVALRDELADSILTCMEEKGGAR